MAIFRGCDLSKAVPCKGIATQMEVCEWLVSVSKLYKANIATDYLDKIVDHLFLFLSRIGTNPLLEKLWLDDRLPEGPELSWKEAEAHPFSQLELLIQDIWEHIFLRVKINKTIIDSLVQLNTNSILDFGGGVGFHSFALAYIGKNVHYLESNNIKANFFYSLVEAYDMTDKILFQKNPSCDSLDALLLINVLDHLENPSSTLSTLMPLLKSRGHVFIEANFQNDGWHFSNKSVKKDLAAFLFLNVPLCSMTSRYPQLMIRTRRNTDSILIKPNPLLKFVKVDSGFIVNKLGIFQNNFKLALPEMEILVYIKDRRITYADYANEFHNHRKLIFHQVNKLLLQDILIFIE